jgi:hypothetical protein
MKTLQIALRAALPGIMIITPSILGAQFPWVCSFDNNNTADLLWHYKGNSVAVAYNAVWLMNGTTMDPRWLPTSGDLEWSMSGTGKFHTTPDSYRDIVWRHNTLNYAVVWLMNGLIMTGWAPLYVPSGTDGVNFRIAATADFNRDGYTDIVWEHKQNGTKSVYQCREQTMSPRLV